MDSFFDRLEMTPISSSPFSADAHKYSVFFVFAAGCQSQSKKGPDSGVKRGHFG